MLFGWTQSIYTQGSRALLRKYTRDCLKQTNKSCYKSGRIKKTITRTTVHSKSLANRLAGKDREDRERLRSSASACQILNHLNIAKPSGYWYVPCCPRPSCSYIIMFPLTIGQKFIRLWPSAHFSVELVMGHIVRRVRYQQSHRTGYRWMHANAQTAHQLFIMLTISSSFRDDAAAAGGGARRPVFNYI